MRKLFLALAVAAPAMAVASTGAAAFECFPRPYASSLYDCYGSDGSFLYTTQRPGNYVPDVGPATSFYAPVPLGYRAAPPRYAYYRDYRDPDRYDYNSYYSSPAGHCGRFRYWDSWARRCVDVRYQNRY
jgi:hypothetical protein